MSQAGIAVSSGGGGSSVQTITGNSGGAVPPTANNINLVGSGGVTVSGNPGTSTLTITTSAVAVTWTDQGSNFNAASQNGYFCTAALTATLPASPSNGDTIIFETVTASSVTIAANTGQRIILGSNTTALAGTADSSEIGNSMTIVYRSTNSSWYATSSIGTWVLT